MNCCAITDNARCCNTYVHDATRIRHNWLNRKGQRKAYDWDQFNKALARGSWPGVRIRKDLSPFPGAEAY